MGIALSILIAAAGAILRYGVNGSANRHGFNLDIVGAILMIVGAVGLVASLVSSGANRFGRNDTSTTRRDETITTNGQEQGRSMSATRDSNVT